MNRNQNPLTVRSTQKARSQAQNKKKKTRKSNRNGNPRAGTAKPALHLSPCAQSYARARLDPFSNAMNDFPCIPDLLDLPSYKFSTFNRGVTTIGTGGIGYVAVAPEVFNNDLTYAVNTGPSFAGVTLDFTGGATGVISAPDTKYPWASTAPRNVRCVALGLRVRYIGTQLNLGGMTVFHNNTGGYTYQGKALNEITQVPAAVIQSCTRQWKGMTWNSARRTSYDYSPIGNNAVTNTGSANIGLLALLSGTPGNNYEFEIVRYFEATENASTVASFPVPSTTKSNSDVVGMGLVRDFLASETVSDIGNVLLKRFASFASNGAAAAATTYFAPSGPRIEWR